jgi:plastocyanin
MTKRGFVVTIFIIGALLAACAQQAPEPEPVNYTIELSEYAFSPQAIEAEVGQEVTLTLVNKGVLEHEIMFGRQVKMTENRPDGFHSDMFQTADVEPQVTQEQMSEMSGSMHGPDPSGIMVVLPKTGDQATMTFEVTEEMEGEWEIGCFSQAGVHYDAGMKGKFVVKR